MSEMVLESFPLMDEDTDRYCACGCGERLKPGAKRTFIHGHKKAARHRSGDVEDEGIEPDPEPSEAAVAKASIRVTARVKKEMQETLEAYLSMGAGVWAMSDPYCGGALVDQASLIAEKLVPVLARNQTAVRYFRSSTAFKEGMDLFLVLWPVMQMVGRHHLFHTIGDVNAEVPVVDYNGYVA